MYEKGLSMRLMIKVNWFVVFIGVLGSSSAFAVSELWLNRYAYDAIQQGFNKSDISVYNRKRADIDNYALAAYTDYRAFLFDITNKTPEQVNQFSLHYSDYPFSVSIRADYLNAMIASKNWKSLLDYQTTPPRDQDYQCWYYTAFYHQDNKEMAFSGAKKLWLNGESVSNACNGLFSYWDKAGERTDEVIFQRALLAVQSKNPRLITYLRKLVSNEEMKDLLSEMLRLYKQPDKLIMTFETKEDSLFTRDYAQVMFRHLARHDIDKAHEASVFLNDHFSFSINEFQPSLEYAAVRLLDIKDEEIIQWRDSTFDQSTNDQALEQRIRLAIRKTEWKDIQHWVIRLSEEEQASYRWQYWLGRSEISLGEKENGEARLKRIAGDRHFYSVAAAITLNRMVKYPISSVDLDTDKLSPFLPDIERVNELLDLGKEAAAKSQWRHLISRVDKRDKALLTRYAVAQNWNAFAHDATLVGELWDYIELRFPVRYQALFKRYSKKHKVNMVTLLSLTRQESGFDPSAHSPVGALGLMQVLPSTAAYVADKYNLEYKKRSMLFNPNKNVEIGSKYLGHLLRHYDQNRALAFAAYNAGPTMVAVWRRQASNEIDIFGYIESISFKETRVYVKNILMFEMYYRDLLKIEGDFLTASELKWTPSL